MKKIGVFDHQKNLIGIMRFTTESFTNIFGLPNFDETKFFSQPEKLVPIELNQSKINEKILFLLDLRDNSTDDTPEYKGRFKDEEIFEFIEFNGQKLKLCNSSDNVIIFLIKIYRSLIKNSTLYLFLGQNSREILDFGKNR